MTTTTAPDTLEAIADAITTHRPILGGDQHIALCGCGKTWRTRAEQRTHAAEVVRDAAVASARRAIADELAAALDDVADSLKRTASGNAQASIPSRLAGTYNGQRLQRMADAQKARAEGIHGAAVMVREYGGAA